MTKSEYLKAKRGTIGFTLRKGDIESPKGDSLTVQNDSMSMKEIVSKFANGLSITGGSVKNQLFVGDADFDSPDVEKFQQSNLVDQHDQIREQKERAKDIAQTLRKQQKNAFLKEKAKKDALASAASLAGEGRERPGAVNEPIKKPEQT